MARAPRKKTEVLVVGAGPTGLVLGLWLTKLGVGVRIIDKAEAPGTHSRALAVQARTLEFYRQLGFAEEVTASGTRFTAVNLWTRGEKAARIPIGEIGEGLSPYPFVLIFPQDQHERLLIGKLAEAGVEVERGVELVSFSQNSDGVQALLRRADGGEERCSSVYIAGCDGARSAVRETLRADFPGGTYAQTFYVADVQARGPVMNHELNIALDEADFLAVFPLKDEGAARLIGTVRPDGGAPREDLGWDDVSPTVIGRLGIEVEQVNWFSTYRVHHRVTGAFRHGRAFLLGDAAHIHSPVGGQGMNTGIGDAVNLGWKLAAVLQRRALPALLESYQPERIAFAHRLVATTDQAFTFASKDGPLARQVRLNLAPRLLPALTQTEAARRFLFRTVSQIQINYRSGPLSRGGAGKVIGGDRLPWTGTGSGTAGGDNFIPLATLDWQVHVYGEARPAAQDLCAMRGLALREYPWRDDYWRAGLMQDALYLVRPDGYVALAEPNGRAEALERFLDKWEIEPRAAAAPASPRRRTRAAGSTPT
jgi:2-polyprenyl-6-methoxyphenol hydroxylase-like FAD-dependent oxidoreductase